MRHQLSSSITFFYKFIFPSVWLLGFGGGTLAMLKSGNQHAPIFVLATVLGASSLCWLVFPLKRVIAVEGGLLVSNYLKEELIPYPQITTIHENKWINIRPITLTLKAPCRFGLKIRFMPYQQLSFAFWRDHPASEFLRSRIAGRQS